ncbi:MAG TPA: M20 family peptidase [Verrucomicrobiae bacterium]|nr:M20 family peptidase [Verrucomicrobiae bacterium]
MSAAKRTLAGLLIFVVVLIAVGLYRTAAFPSKQLSGVPVIQVAVAADAAAERLAKGIAFPTVSNQNKQDTDRAAFIAYHEYLARVFPHVHEQLILEKPGNLSLLYTWKGKDPSKAPVVIMGHQDVVPVVPGTEKDWEHPPFSGALTNGYVWGRGALDDKVMVQAILEAVETLLIQNHQPSRTIYLAFGHDEEVGGADGMKAVVQSLKAKGIKQVALVLDEGLPIAPGLFPGINGPTALVGIAEKGYLSLELRVDGEGGHSAMPPRHSNIGILAQAIRRLEDNPFPLRLTPVVKSQFDYLGPEMPFKSRLVLANLWLFRGLFMQTMSRSPRTAAFLRTTTATTMFNAGVKENVMPTRATAVVNFRILPGDSVNAVTHRVREMINDDRVQIREVSPPDEPSPVSDTHSQAYALLDRTIREIWGTPDLKVAPLLVIGGTDARHFSELSRNIFRFTAVQVESAADSGRWHGTNERVLIREYAKSIGFFQLLIQRLENL